MTSRRALLLAGIAAAAAVGTGVVLSAGWLLSGRTQAAPRPAPGSVVLADPTGGTGDVGAFTGLRPPDHDRPTAVWMQRHGRLAGARGATCTICHPPSRCLNCHRTPMPHVAGWSKAHGKAVLASGSQLCLRCHQDGTRVRPTLVSLGERLNCRTCHRLAMPHPARWVAAGHRSAARQGTAVCATCHTRQTCETCHASNKVSSCRTCHANKVLAIERPGGHPTSQCLTCHQQARGAIGPGPGHRTVPLCLRCHTSTKLVRRAPPQSERDWTTANGLGFTAWAKRGSHASPQLIDCSRCHTPHSAETVSFPIGTVRNAKGCGLGCHTWLKGDVVSRGFLNATGDPDATTYRGPISPELLLANGTTKHTTVVYASTGCAGRCHQGPHGAVTMCITCHNYKWNSPDNLHSTHVPLITAERAAADPGNNNGQAVCMYCHRPGTNGVPDGATLWRRACYNCHLSGHDPEVPYWKLPGA